MRQRTATVRFLTTVAAQMDLWRAIVHWCSECDMVLDTLEFVAVTAVVALALKRRKVDL